MSTEEQSVGRRLLNSEAQIAQERNESQEARRIAEEGIEWCRDWKEGMFTPAPTQDGWTVEMYGLVDSHEQLSQLVLKLLTEQAEQRIEKLQIVLRRKVVLDNYGITIENVKFDEWLAIISSDDRLEAWFGEPLEKHILDELAAAELLESYS